MIHCIGRNVLIHIQRCRMVAEVVVFHLNLILKFKTNNTYACAETKCINK